MRSRKMTPVALALGAALAVGGCGGGSEDAATVDSATGGAEPAAPGSTPTNPEGTIGAGGTVGTGPGGTSEPMGTTAIDTAGGTAAAKGTGTRPPPR